MIFEKTEFQEYAGGANTRENSMPNKTRSKMAVKRCSRFSMRVQNYGTFFSSILGCDMVYPDASKTHFYGEGTPDPLREDFTLRDLYAKSARFMCIAARNGCSIYNLSEQPSKLCFPRRNGSIADKPCDFLINSASVQSIIDQENSLGYFISSGRYWEADVKIDLHALDKIDQQWKTLSDTIDRAECYT